jgi:hypothetical protein
MIMVRIMERFQRKQSWKGIEFSLLEIGTGCGIALTSRNIEKTDMRRHAADLDSAIEGALDNLKALHSNKSWVKRIIACLATSINNERDGIHAEDGVACSIDQVTGCFGAQRRKIISCMLSSQLTDIGLWHPQLVEDIASQTDEAILAFYSDKIKPDSPGRSRFSVHLIRGEQGTISPTAAVAVREARRISDIEVYKREKGIGQHLRRL